MALTSGSLLDNIELSLDSYILGALSATFSAALIQLHGERRFVRPGDTETPWLTVRYDNLELRRRFHRSKRTELEGDIDLLIAQHARRFAERYRLASSRDAVIAAFPEAGRIYVYSSGVVSAGAEIGSLFIYGLTGRLVDTGEVTGLVQRSVTITVRYLEIGT